MNRDERKSDHRAQVRAFLLSRRERITPEKAGLPAYGGSNRRVKGLRREEVALLAGVSVDYYVRMERGNLAGASEAVLDGVADALQLDDAEREHLFALARAAGPPSRRVRPSATAVRPAVQQVLDAITGGPAWIRNARHDILATNPLAAALYSPILESQVARVSERHPANTTRFMYLDPAAQDYFIEYDRMAQDAAAMLRLEAGRNPRDAELHALVGELSTRSELFRKNWAANNVKFHRSGRKRLRHPAVGELDLNFEAMELSSDAELRLNVYTADPDTPTADGLRLLGTWAATRQQHTESSS
ncbi:helix-turn-helix transcriptional regulator [Gordonia hydrophobica]|uniref:Helix-turn-helix transcriptional regulator n=1 Tax=Gordonia hydrophobica TaxID=40516 RepID=A0ABZ2TZG6_9ACTN|nr:helix-turn-helix transcriptional regulator [Gordonia hydrophobica]MBM7366236.1 transcriptional regulator with XRE-family HTH domain [Gordonia hydrophobica]